MDWPTAEGASDHWLLAVVIVIALVTVVVGAAFGYARRGSSNASSPRSGRASAPWMIAMVLGFFLLTASSFAVMYWS